MKKIYLFLLLLAPFTQAFSHYLWIETASSGSLNTSHIIKIKYGEFAYDEIEEVTNEAFIKVKNFDLWVIAPNGEKKELKATANGDHYQANFTPTQSGNYIVYLDNKKMEVVDSSQYNFGIYKPQYHATARINIGKTTDFSKSTNTEGLDITEIKNLNNAITLRVSYKKEALNKSKVMVFFKDGWSKELETDEKGEVTFTLPWPTAYTIEVIHIDKTAGQYKQVPYEFIYNCTTHYIHQQTNS